MATSRPGLVTGRFATGLILLYFLAVLLKAFWDFSGISPDEWGQYPDLAYMMVTGIGYADGPYVLHRNLFFPFMLTIPHWVSEFFNLPEPWGRLALVRIFVGCLNLGVLWGMLQLWRGWKLADTQQSCGEIADDEIADTQQLGEKLILVIFTATSFSLGDATRPGLEHLSAIMIWFMLGCYASRKKFANVGTGFFAVLTGVARYPSGIFGAVFVFALLWHLLRCRHPGKWREVGHLLGGCLLGFFFGFLPDQIMYGRFYQSIYMYVIYNVFSGLDSVLFADEGPWAYFLFLGRQLLPYSLIGPIAVLGFGREFISRLWRGSPLVIALSGFVLAHIFAGHREGRFIAPVMLLLCFIAMVGILRYYPVIVRSKKFARLGFLQVSIGLAWFGWQLYIQRVSATFAFVHARERGHECVVSQSYFPAAFYARDYLMGAGNGVGYLSSSGDVRWVEDRECSSGKALIITRRRSQAPEGCVEVSREGLQVLFMRNYLCEMELEDLKALKRGPLVGGAFRRFLPMLRLPSLSISSKELQQFITKRRTVALSDGKLR